MPPLIPVRRGVTLAELMVSIALLGLIATVVQRTLVEGGRTYRAQMRRIDVHQTLQIAATLLPAVFRDLDARGGDLLAVSADSVRVRATRHVAFLCAPADFGAPTTLLIARHPASGLRGLDPATDSLLVYKEGDPTTPADDGWVAGELLSVTDAVCPAPDGRAARALRVRLAFAAGQLDRRSTVPAGAPIHGYEPMTYLSYRAGDGHYYLGERSGGDLQPLLGPLTAGGLRLVYYDAAGHRTLDRLRVAAVEARVRASQADSVVVHVALRGNARW